MIRARPAADAPISRRRALRAGFLGIAGLLAAEAAVAVAPFLRVRRIVGLGTPVAVGTREEVLAAFAGSDDRPILFTRGRFFLLHPPGGIIAVYRKCTHLGCAVPWDARNDRFTCPCHGS
ncbi:MAG: Rieske 2Fe-2S domain-containing protein, partial [Solirubrobacteraceae bacterium]